MANEDIINELLSIEMMCEQLKQRCYTTRKKLEGDNSPVSPKGEMIAAKAAAVVARRMRNLRFADSEQTQ